VVTASLPGATVAGTVVVVGSVDSSSQAARTVATIREARTAGHLITAMVRRRGSGRRLRVMRRARLLVHGALRDFLSEARRSGSFGVAFELPVGLRDLIQSVGIPHVEVARVTVDGVAVDWGHVVHDGDDIEAHSRYPLAEPPAGPRFVLDAHLGKLASYLRLVGLDAEYDPARDDPELVEQSNQGERALLTRDRGLLMHASLQRGCFVRSTAPLGQAAEVVGRFALRGLLDPFSRCTVCNGELVDADPHEVADRVPAPVVESHSEFRRCPGCGRIYWQGSHHRRLRRVVEHISHEP
jgi:uncharacterized protein with PIN domain